MEEKQADQELYQCPLTLFRVVYRDGVIPTALLPGIWLILRTDSLRTG